MTNRLPSVEKPQTMSTLPNAKRPRPSSPVASESEDSDSHRPNLLRLRTLENELFAARVEEAVKVFDGDAFELSKSLGYILHAHVHRDADGYYRSKVIERDMCTLATHLDALYTKGDAGRVSFLSSEYHPAGERLRICVKRDDV